MPRRAALLTHRFDSPVSRLKRTIELSPPSPWHIGNCERALPPQTSGCGDVQDLKSKREEFLLEASECEMIAGLTHDQA